MHDLDVGAPAPDPEFTDAGGARLHLSSLWAARPAVLLFLRHFG